MRDKKPSLGNLGRSFQGAPGALSQGRQALSVGDAAGPWVLGSTVMTRPPPDPVPPGCSGAALHSCRGFCPGGLRDTVQSQQFEGNGGETGYPCADRSQRVPGFSRVGGREGEGQSWLTPSGQPSL